MDLDYICTPMHKNIFDSQLSHFFTESENEEICDLTYIEMNKNRYVISVGWDKNVNIYSDAPDGGVHHIQHPLPKWPDDVVRKTHVFIFTVGGGYS